MTGSESRPAPGARWRPSGWRDPRLVVGLVLVLVALVGVVTLMRVTNSTEGLYVAARDLPQGAPVVKEDLKVVQAKPGDGGAAYLREGEALEPGTRTVALVKAGELVPRRALGHDDGTGRRTMSVTVDGDLPRGVEPGQRVDVYATEDAIAGAEKPAPELVGSALEIADVQPVEGGLASTPQVRLQLLVPSDRVQDLVRTTGERTRLTVVAAPVGQETAAASGAATSSPRDTSGAKP